MRPMRVPVLKRGVIIVVHIVCGVFVLVPCFGVFFGVLSRTAIHLTKRSAVAIN